MGQATVKCRHCGTPTPMLGTRECDPCRALRVLMEHDPEMARKMLGAVIESTVVKELSEVCGFIANSSDTVVTISQDDATRTYHLKVKGYNTLSVEKRYFGGSLVEVIHNAYLGEKESNG